MKLSFLVALCFVFLFTCKKKTETYSLGNHINKTQTLFHGNSFTNPQGETIEKRFLLPRGFIRAKVKPNSFANYLRNCPLKPYGTKVKYFNSNIKENNNVYSAVIDLDIGDKDLHQCADAIMRLRAEFLWNQKKYNDIHFNFTNGFRVDYSEWMKGKRILVNGNDTKWIQKKSPSNTYKDFWEYLEIVFVYAGTHSLSKELQSIKTSEMKIGDVFIQGGFPGHAVIIVDMAINPNTKQKIFLLAQSYMPAQEIHILKNRNDKSISPWYSNDFGNVLKTPEWTFYNTDLKRFE